MEAKAILRKAHVSPRKIRKVANLVRGLKISRALTSLRFERSPNARPVEQLLLSAVANWQAKHTDSKIPETELYIKEICVDAAPIVKRYRPVPHGRAHRIRKRASHVRLCISATAEAIAASTVDKETLKNTTTTEEKAMTSSEKK